MEPESRFSQPRPECPHPERWHSTDWDSAEAEVSELVAGFVRALQPDLVVETGTAFGQTAEAIARALATNGQGVLHTCETDPERYAIAMERAAVGPVVFHLRPSLEVIDELAPRSVGLAWLDSLITLRVPEIRSLRPKLLTGAIVGFHDSRAIAPDEVADDDWRGYRPSIEALFGEGWLRGISLPTPRGVLFAEVLG